MIICNHLWCCVFTVGFGTCSAPPSDMTANQLLKPPQLLDDAGGEPRAGERPQHCGAQRRGESDADHNSNTTWAGAATGSNGGVCGRGGDAGAAQAKHDDQQPRVPRTVECQSGCCTMGHPRWGRAWPGTDVSGGLEQRLGGSRGRCEGWSREFPLGAAAGPAPGVRSRHGEELRPDRDDNPSQTRPEAMQWLWPQIRDQGA